MEQRAEYGPWHERPRLTVVHDAGATYSALPHAVLTDARTKHGHIVTYAVLQMHWWKSGECWAGNAVLRAEVKCSDAQLRRYLKDLVAWGFITERKRGEGQGKAYAPAPESVSLPSQPLTDERFNRSDMSGSGCQPLTGDAQPLTGDDVNRSPVSALYKKTSKKKTKEEDISIPGDSPEQVVFDYYRSKIQPAARLNAPEKIRSRLKRFSVEELKQGIDKFAADSWWMDNNGTRGAAWFFHSDQRSEQFLNLKPRVSANGKATIPPGAASKQQSKWSEWKGRHGGNTVGMRSDDGR